MTDIKILSCHETAESEVFAFVIEADIGEGVEELNFCLRPDDNHGLAPQVREAFLVWIDDDNLPEPAEPQTISRDQVNAEADRRLNTAFAFNGTIYDFGAKAKSRITGAATLAGFAITNGAQAGDYLWHGGSTPFSWITADNSIVQLDAQSTFALGQTAANWETLHVFAAKALKETSPIPLDYADDSYWPVQPTLD